jgi:hypothetical protein
MILFDARINLFVMNGKGQLRLDMPYKIKAGESKNDLEKMRYFKMRTLTCNPFPERQSLTKKPLLRL